MLIDLLEELDGHVGLLALLLLVLALPRLFLLLPHAALTVIVDFRSARADGEKETKESDDDFIHETQPP